MSRGSAWVAATLALALGAPRAQAAVPVPASPTVRAAQMVDLAPTHWAYASIESLLEKYRIISGYPDMTFRGEKSVSRYELASALANLMNRIDTMQDRGAPIPTADSQLIDRLRDEFKVELLNLHMRVTALEEASGSVMGILKEIKGLIVANNKVHGNLGLTVQDDPEDRLKPFVVSNFEVKFGSDLDEHTSYSASISGGQAAAGSGGTPLFTRGKDIASKGLPNGNVTLGTNAQITTKVAGLGDGTFKVGYFAPGAMVGLGGFAHHYGDGIIGSGLSGPSGNTVRTGAEDIGLGFKGKASILGFGAGVNTQFVYGGASIQFGELGDFRLIADYDHNSIGNVSLEGDPSWHAATSLNFGSDKTVGLSLQGGMSGVGAKYTPKAGANLIFSPFGTEICAGATLKSDPDLTTFEVIPTGYLFLPQGFFKLPVVQNFSLLAGAKEPETVVAGSGSPGPGSLLGTKAGWTVQLGIANPLMPNLTLEANLQANVLFGDYDGWGYAISTSTDF